MRITLENVKRDNTQIALSRDLVLALLGDTWPDSGKSAYWPSGFGWDGVDEFVLEDGQLVPYAGGFPAPGPDFKLEIV